MKYVSAPKVSKAVVSIAAVYKVVLFLTTL